MFKKDLKNHQGMLFFLEQPQQTAFWMQNTPLSLDIIFMDGSKKITKVFSSAQPLSLRKIFSPPNTLYVLEIRGGESQRQKICEGDDVEWSSISEKVKNLSSS